MMQRILQQKKNNQTPKTVWQMQRGLKNSLSIKYLGEEINDDEFTSQILNKFWSDETENCVKVTLL